MTEQDEERCPCGEHDYANARERTSCPCGHCRYVGGMWLTPSMSDEAIGVQYCPCCGTRLNSDGTHGLSYAQLEAQARALANQLAMYAAVNSHVNYEGDTAAYLQRVEEWLEWSAERAEVQDE